MKYNVVISRTYATELVVEADNKEGVHEWLETHKNKVYHEELEQCNIISDDVNVELVEPSPSEAEELLDLAYHIHRLLHNYSHVADFVPKEIRDSLEKMSSHYNND
jgi:uncharacterized membrane protein YheB (UPF0754 family)